jgi:hypothetical protein
MVLDLRVNALAGVVAITCCIVVAVRLASAPGPTPRRLATESERLEAAAVIASLENGWREETTQNFPSDNWSQRDDFHGREYKRAIELANAKGLRIEDVLRAVDDDIHRRKAARPSAVDIRDARAIPCKPRPFYD